MKIENNFDLTESNSYRVKAKCKRAFFPEHEDDFVGIYKENTESKRFLLGGGFNVILSKSYYDEDFIMVGEAFSKTFITDNEIEAESGVDLKTLSKLALSNGLSGLEMFYDIPSSLGGAVVMNAGASGEEIKDLLIKVRYLDLVDMKIKDILKKDMDFGYRNSIFQKNSNKIVLKIWLKLKDGDPELIEHKMNSIKEARWAKQPKDFPNAGSVFKRPEGHFVGAMIEELGLKGFSVGGAKVSEKHSGFIVNYNKAKGEDILNLIKEIKLRVLERFGVDLEIEQRVV